MNVAAAILLGAGVFFLALGGSVYRGNAKLIHDYHQEAVTPARRREYCRAISKGIFVLGGTLLVSGGLECFGERRPFFAAALVVLFAGLTVSLLLLIAAQRKYAGEKKEGERR